MNDLTVRKLEMSVRVAGFLSSSPIAFRKGSLGPQLVGKFKQAVEEVQALGGKQLSAVSNARAQSGERAAAREALIEAMGRISRCAQGMSVSNPKMEPKFRMPWSTGDSGLLASAHSFAENADAYRAEFIRFEMPPDFLEDLSARIAAFEQAFASHNASKTTQVGIQRQIREAIQRVMALLEELDPIVENKLAGDVAEIQKWKNVRHIERAWVSKKPVEAKPENNPPAAAA